MAILSSHQPLNISTHVGILTHFPLPELTQELAGIGANVNQTTSANNRTLWPTTGGSLSVDFHHPFTYVFINLGLGSTPSVFNITLNSEPLNETGNGTLCLPHLQLPAGLDIMDGTNASIQISTVGPEGTALYNVRAFQLS